MKTVVMLLGFLFLGALGYYGYSYGIQKSAEFDQVEKSIDLPIEKNQSIDTEVVIDEEESNESDIAVKTSLEDEPLLIEDEEDIIAEESITDEDIEIKDIEMIVDEQEELMEEAVKEEIKESDNKVYSPQEIMQKIEKEKAGIPILETEEDRIIREEEERNRAAIEEDNKVIE